MNDLVTPFLAVFLSEALGQEQEGWRPDSLSEEQLLEVEADSYWCLCRLLEGIQDHYTDAQPGIQKAVFRIKEVVRCAAPGAAAAAARFAWRGRALRRRSRCRPRPPLSTSSPASPARLARPRRANDARMAEHLEEQGLDFLQFSFRWVNCLLIREVPFQLAVRMWDTYLAEGPKFPEFLVGGGAGGWAPGAWALAAGGWRLVQAAGRRQRGRAPASRAAGQGAAGACAAGPPAARRWAPQWSRQRGSCLTARPLPQVYACAAFLLVWKDSVLTLEFQDLVLFLQKLPTQVGAAAGAEAEGAAG
jgi:hypothetical protein